MADALQGTWVFNDSIDLSTITKGFSVSFISNSTNYELLSLFAGSIFVQEMQYGGYVVYGAGGSWTDEAYKTIAITSKLSEVTDGETLLTWLQANATKQPSLSFKHFFSNSPIGIGTIRFRPYTVAEPLPQLATPQNVSADGTTVSWDAVENATSYAVLANGSEIGTVEAGPTGGTLTINFIDSANAGGEVIINNGAPQRIYGSQTKVYENVYYFEFRVYILGGISNQTGSMVGITSNNIQYEINGDGSATIEFED